METQTSATPDTVAQDTTTTATAPDFQSFIPQEYKDKPYLKTIKDSSEFFKQFDNLQSSFGKKSGLPGMDAPDDEWDKFFDTSGFRPKESTAYEITKPELPEGANLPENYEERMRAIIHESGLSPLQAKRLTGKYNEWVSEQSKNLIAETEARRKELDEEFEGLADQYFGKNDKAQAFETAKKLMGSHLPEELQEHLGQLDNKSLVILTKFANDIAKKYISEDKLPTDGNSSGGAKSAAELDSEGIKLMQSDEFRDPMHPSHEAMKQKVRGIYEQITKLERKK